MDSAKLPISGPCPIDLDAIGFDRTGKTSHCAHCDKNVHQLSNMTRKDARAFLTEHAGQKLCVSYRRDTTGKVMFKQPAPPTNVVSLSRVRDSGRRVAARRSTLAAAGVALAAALAACTPHADVTELAGKMEIVDPKTDEKKPEKEPCDTPKVNREDAIPLAGAAVIPPPEDIDDVMVEGEIEVEAPEPEPESDFDPRPRQVHR